MRTGACAARSNAAPAAPTAAPDAPALVGPGDVGAPASSGIIFEETLSYVRVHETTRRSARSERHPTTVVLHPPFPDSDDEYCSAHSSLSDRPSLPPQPTRRAFRRREPERGSLVHRSTRSDPPLSRRVSAGDVPLPDDESDDEDDAATVTTVATNTTASSHSSSKRARAKMAARVVSKPIKKSYVGMVAGLASTVGLGQAMFLKATYQSPPDARGPRSGVERPRVETLSSAEGLVTRILPSVQRPPAAPVAASQAAQDAVNAAVDAAVESVREELRDIDLSPVVERHGNELVTKHKRILIIGDSLVSGVGGLSSFDDGPSDGPALPRQVARYLSEMLNVDVQWNALSLTGGDVRMLKRKIVPMLTREKERGTIGDISAVVLVTGVNDWKRISPIRTANKFREDLEEFIVKIREQVGEDCRIFLPAIPGVRYTPRFHEPLRSIVIFLNDYWDSQKVQLSRSMRYVYFVGQPPNHEWGANPRQFFSTLDRVHPSELGYDRWAERIAEHMVAAFKKRVAKAANRSSEAVNLAAQTATAAVERCGAATTSAVEQAADVAGAAAKDVSTATAAVAAVASCQQAPQSP